MTPFKPIELDAGVVPTDAEVGASTYLEPKAFVADIVYDCVLNGELLEIKKTPAAKASVAKSAALAGTVQQPAAPKP